MLTSVKDGVTDSPKCKYDMDDSKVWYMFFFKLSRRYQTEIIIDYVVDCIVYMYHLRLILSRVS